MIIHMSKISANTTTASARIAQWLSNFLGHSLIDSGGNHKPEDIVIIVNSPTAFCDWLDQVVELAMSAKRLIWVMNDYTLYPPTQLRDALGMRKMELWTTVPELSDRLADRWTYRNFPKVGKYVNWNLLTLQPAEPVLPTEEGLVYWGAFREYRVESFRRFFTDRYPVHISTTNRAVSKFEDLCPTSHVYGPAVPLIPWIQRFPFSIYIEDKWSHEMYCSPANRFYEAVSAGIPLLVDSKARGVFRDLPLMDEWIVENDKDVEERIPHLAKIKEDQRVWAKLSAVQLERQVQNAGFYDHKG